MKSRYRNRQFIIVVVLLTPLFLNNNVLAATANMSQVEGFLRSVIQTIAGLAGLIATGFFVVGGLRYITSSGHPEHLERAKRTIMFAATGLAITIAAFVLSNIVTSLASSAFGG